MFYINQMWKNICLLEEPNERYSSHLLILQLNLPLSEKKSILPFQTPIILLHVDQMYIPKLILILRQHLHRILHEHLPINLIHYHHSRIINRILLRMRLLPQQLIIHLILMIFIIMIDMLPQFIQQEYKLTLLD